MMLTLMQKGGAAGEVCEAAPEHALPAMRVISAPDRRLLGSKLQAPTAGGHQVPRQAIVDAVAASAGAKLVLLRAPAGFGKTTAMLQCRERLEAEGVATAWLTLDSADNDTSRFVVGLEAAIADIVGDPVDAAHDALLERRSERGDIALDLIARLHGYKEPFALFLDELDAIHEPGIFGLLREIIEHLPRRGQIVIGSRSLPDLMLGRLRARGHLLEMDTAHLRFSMEEAGNFINERRRIALAPDDLDRLYRKTEGWIAALWLASIALNSTRAHTDFIDRFSGTNGPIADYLAEEVLARQTPAVRMFLLRTSILRHLEVPLCQVVSPDVNSERILHDLAATDVLLVSLGEDRRAYRYHSLFAGFLRAQLARELPGEAAGLHAALSRWYEGQGRPVPAIEHAIDGGDVTNAMRLMSHYAPDLLAKGRMRLLSRWFAALPADAPRSDATLQLVRMWAACFTSGPWDAMKMLQDSGLDACTEVGVAPHVRALRPTLLAMMDNYEEAYAVGSKNLKQLPSSVPFADNVLANTMATIATAVGERREARHFIEVARRGQGQSVSPFNQMYSEAGEGVLDLQEGRLRQALARFRMAVMATCVGGYGQTGGNAFAGVPYAAAIYEVDDLDQAAQLLQVYLPMARDIGLPDHVILGYLTQTRISFARGDVDHAWQTLSEFEYAGHTRQLPRVVATAKLERSRLLLLQGQHHAAREEMERASHPSVWERVSRLRFVANEIDDMEVTRLRWQLHAGDARQALIGLETARTVAKQGARHQRAWKLGVLQSMALDRLGDNAAAVQMLSGVLREVAADGFVRLVLDEGEAVGEVLRALEIAIRREEVPPGTPIFRDYVHRLSQHFGRAVADVHPAGTDIMLDPLTRKEIRVLQLVAEGYSNPAMAEKLFVSDSTVRTHLRNINTKLTTKNRTQAVAVARRLGQIR